MKKDIAYLHAQKRQGRKITALTCYDFPTARLEDEAGVDMLFVGDSVGTNILGYASEQEVTLADIAHHLRAVKRGTTQSFILADLPYATYETPDQALTHARILTEHGADAVKLEGIKPLIVRHLTAHGIRVCGHIGLEPQTHQQKSVQGKTFEAAKDLINGARVLEQAGISLLVLELIPSELARVISQWLSIPTIGIGAGPFTDGQVLIIQDILGLTPRKLKLAKLYQELLPLTRQAIAAYKEDVETRQFPGEENTRHMPDPEWQLLQEWLQNEQFAQLIS